MIQSIRRAIRIDGPLWWLPIVGYVGMAAIFVGVFGWIVARNVDPVAAEDVDPMMYVIGLLAWIALSMPGARDVCEVRDELRDVRATLERMERRR